MIFNSRSTLESGGSGSCATVLKQIHMCKERRCGKERVSKTSMHRSAVHCILQQNDMYPYKYVRVQHLQPEDFMRRLQFSRWILGEIERNSSFLSCVLWTDEALFTREGCFNAHNSHVWDVQNPIAIRTRAVQNRWSVNVWAGICGDFVVGPYILPNRLDGPSYRIFVEHVLPTLLEEIPLEYRRNMFYQHDGAPAHYAASVRSYLNEAFQDRWIGRVSTVAWPPRSPDLTPLDFFFWGFLKNEVYREEITTAEETVARIHAAVSAITPETLRKGPTLVVRHPVYIQWRQGFVICLYYRLYSITMCCGR